MVTVLLCVKHNMQKECISGASAHVSNWYCPECDKENEDDTKRGTGDTGGKREQRIVCAALRNKDGYIICSPRHFDSLAHQQIQLFEKGAWAGAEQGFVDQHQNFLTRTEAWKIAEAQGQILRRCGGDTAEGGTLYSENLY